MLLFVLSHLMSLLGEFLFVFLFCPGEISTQKIDPLETHVSEGDLVTLSCIYRASTGDVLQWYRQYPTSRPEFIVSIQLHEESKASHLPRLYAVIERSKSHLQLNISSAAVSDSAMYYCALRPTVTGNTATLYKNLFPHKESFSSAGTQLKFDECMKHH
uniref:Ig-like domain-containing protein n=1 Tax=Electrophorus electricus TaxID=8005 RepID=A0AAY5F2I9_ELEEL